jgi:hypothetical protein
MEWKQRLAEPFGVNIIVSTSFITEKKLETAELGLFDYDIASMSLEVHGHTDEFVESCFDKLSHFMNSAKLAGIYTPLLIFRNKVVVYIISNSLALASMFVIQTIASRRLESSYYNTKEKIVNNIISNKDINAKIDALAAAMLTPEQSPWWYIVAELGLGAVAFVSTLSILMLCLPMLVPRSYINIGLAKSFYTQRENVFRFIIFTVLLSGIVFPALKILVAMLF